MFSLQGNLAQRLALRVPTLGGSAAATWTPAEATTDGGVSPHTWLYPSLDAGILYTDFLKSTPVASDGDPVGAIVNQGSDTHDLLQSDNNARPSYTEGVTNGRPVFRFDGSADFVKGAFGGAISQPYTLFVVMALDAAVVGNSTNIVALVSNDNNTELNLRQRNSNYWSYQFGTELTSTTATDSNWHIHTCRANGASSAAWLDGALIVSGDGGSDTLSGLTVGANSTGLANWDGDVAEILIYSSNLSDADKNEVGNYLASKYGISYTNI